MRSDQSRPRQLLQGARPCSVPANSRKHEILTTTAAKEPAPASAPSPFPTHRGIYWIDLASGGSWSSWQTHLKQICQRLPPLQNHKFADKLAEFPELLKKELNNAPSEEQSVGEALNVIQQAYEAFGRRDIPALSLVQVPLREPVPEGLFLLCALCERSSLFTPRYIRTSGGTGPTCRDSASSKTSRSAFVIRFCCNRY